MVSSFMEVLPVARIKFKQVEGQALPLTPGPSANSLVMTSWRHCPSCSTKHSIQPGDQQTAAQNMSPLSARLKISAERFRYSGAAEA